MTTTDTTEATRVRPSRSKAAIAARAKSEAATIASEPTEAPETAPEPPADETGTPAPIEVPEAENPAEMETVKMSPRELLSAVESIRAETSGISNRDAFLIVSQRTGRSAGSVSQTYYGAVRSTRKAEPPKVAAAKGRRAPSIAPDSITAQVAALEREVRELRAFKARVVAEIGKL